MKINPPGSVAALVCGIISIVISWVPIAGLVLGIISLMQASKAKRIAASDPEQFDQGGMRVGGFVCGIIGTVFSGLYSCYWVLIIVVLGAVVTNPQGL